MEGAADNKNLLTAMALFAKGSDAPTQSASRVLMRKALVNLVKDPRNEQYQTLVSFAKNTRT